MNAERAKTLLENAIAAIENGDSTTTLQAIRKVKAELLDQTCFDCGEEFDLCECGLDPNEYPDYAEDHFRDDVEADADVLRSAGMGTDEDYGLIGGDSDLWGEF